jgi:predicted nuclease with TOPRIM domain
MDSDSLILVVGGLAGAVGIKEVWSIIRKKMDINHSVSSSQSNYKQKRIEELEDELKQSNQAILELTVKVSKLEERMLHVAKNRVKK